MKKTGPLNPHLQGLIRALRKESHTQEAPLWGRVADELERPTRSRREVNLSRLNRFTKADEIVLVPGKVLGSGALDHKLTIAAFAFSEAAREQIHHAKGEAISIQDLLTKNPKGNKVRLIG